MEKKVKIDIDNITIEGMLSMPEGSKGLVLFAHGSGSSRFSPRNNYVAKKLQEKNMGTLLVDLLSEVEDMDYSKRFDIELLSRRLIGITNWLSENNETKNENIGLFGASTGAAAALIAAVELGEAVKAIVSRGGRPDLAMKILSEVEVPTLLIVGGNDFDVVEMNKSAYEKLGSDIKEMKIVEGATHLFEEPGALERVADLAAEWFKEYLQ